FLEEGAMILSETKKAMDGRDLQELKMQAHTFKGMAAVLTAAQMAQISLDLEQAAKTASFEEAEGHLNRLQNCFDSAKVAIQGILAQKL
ncbi:MAG: Hpt domain-containing protein, partial [Rhizobiaceae bacterium]